MMKSIFFLAALAITCASSALSADTVSNPTSDYDRICGYFDQLKDQISEKILTASKREQFISERVNKGIPQQSDARTLWEVIRYAVPGERYEMFKVTAEEQVGHSWECASMEQLISTTGE